MSATRYVNGIVDSRMWAYDNSEGAHEMADAQKTSTVSSGEAAGRGTPAGEVGVEAIVGEERMGERVISWAA